jgi:hypothetical protein
MAGAGRAVDERSGGIVADAVVEHSGDDEDLLRARLVDVEVRPYGARRDVDDVCSGRAAIKGDLA